MQVVVFCRAIFKKNTKVEINLVSVYCSQTHALSNYVCVPQQSAVQICKTQGQYLAHHERSKSMNRLLFRWTRGSNSVTKTLIVSNKVTVKGAGTWTGALEKY